MFDDGDRGCVSTDEVDIRRDGDGSGRDLSSRVRFDHVPENVGFLYVD